MMARLLLTILRWYSFGLLVYVFMRMLMPSHQITRFLANICEPVLQPVGRFLYKRFPALYKIPFDFSAVAVFLIIKVLDWLVLLLF